ncbi:MAG: PD-(D/E)XK nuclease family protein, partial [Proteobacteria bacterium]|nr:PD-(D/E)XK nuclease family protein [Pseudomonadota bacterium]
CAVTSTSLDSFMTQHGGAGPWILPAKRIVITGLTSLPLKQMEFLGSLSNQPGVEVWLDGTWSDLSEAASLRSLHLACRLPKQDGPLPKSHVSLIHECRDPIDEVALALKRAKDFHAKGTPWQRILIAVPDESIYAGTFALLTEPQQLPVNIPLARKFTETNLGQWLQIFVEWRKSLRSEHFAHLLRHPITQIILENELESWRNFQESCRKSDHPPMLHWLEYFSKAPYKINHSDFFDKPYSLLTTSSSKARQKQPSSNTDNNPDNNTDSNTPINSATTAVGAAWKFFLGPPFLNLIDQTVNIYDHTIEWWKTRILVHISDLAEGRLCGDLSLEISAIEAFRQSLEILATNGVGLRSSFSTAKSIAETLLNLAARTGIRATGEPLKDLQIISLTEARYVPCDVLIIVGLAEGIFPHRMPQDTLIDDRLKTAAGMPGWRQLEALEETTFQLLTTRVPTVELTWPRDIGGQSTIRSRWVERLVAEGVPQAVCEQSTTRTSLQSLVRKSQDEFSYAEQLATEGRGQDVSSLVSSVSASSLKALMSCPFQFLLRKRQIRSPQFKQEQDPRDIGDIFHAVIERTCSPDEGLHHSFSNNMQKEWLWRSDFLDSSDLEAWALARLTFFSHVFLEHYETSKTPQIIEVLYRGWPALARSWGALYKLGWNVALARVEASLGSLMSSGMEGCPPINSVQLSVGSHLISVHGVMDMVLTNQKDQSWGVIDFKSGQEPALSSIKSGREPQLLLYALAIAKDKMPDSDLNLIGGKINLDHGLAALVNLRIIYLLLRSHSLDSGWKE